MALKKKKDDVYIECDASINICYKVMARNTPSSCKKDRLLFTNEAKHFGPRVAGGCRSCHGQKTHCDVECRGQEHRLQGGPQYET